MALVLLFVAVPPAQAQGEKTGSFHLFLPSSLGNSGYTILYEYPAEVPSGRDVTVTVTVEVDQLTGLKQYLSSYGLYVSLSAPGVGNVYAQVNRSNVFLYQGSHWGPVNVTLPAGRSLRSTSNLVAEVSITFFANVWHGDPIFFAYPESGARSAGNLTILAGSPQGALSGNALLLILGSGIAVIVALGILLKAGFPGRAEGRVKPL